MMNSNDLSCKCFQMNKMPKMKQWNDEPIQIDLKDYRCTGGGANGKSYNHRNDPAVMLKMYDPGKSAQARDEYRISSLVYETGIPTPAPGDFVTDGQRFGIRFQRIPGKKSIARAVGDDPQHVAEYAGDFAQMCLQLHATHVDTSLFDNVKDRYYRLLEDNPFFTAPEKDRIGRFIADVPDADTALHGDLQFGNAIFVGKQRYFIDLGDFSYGYPLFDIGMVYATGKLNIESFTQEAFHMDNATAGKFWEAFAQAYFGKDRPLASIEEEVRVYAGIKTLMVERDTRCPMPEFRAALDLILK